MNEFGAFSDILGFGRKAPCYLPLLNLGDPDEVAAAIKRIQKAFRAADPQPAVASMLAELDWRPHLVAAVAFLLDADRVLDRSLLWQAIIKRSWVTPQLVVTAMFTDPDFVQRAVTLVEERGEVDGKFVASVLGLSEYVPGIERQVSEWRQDPRIKRALESDAFYDRSNELSRRLARDIQDFFSPIGITLKVAGD